MNLSKQRAVTTFDSQVERVSKRTGQPKATCERVIREYLEIGIEELESGNRWVIPNTISLWVETLTGRDSLNNFRVRWSEGLKKYLSDKIIAYRYKGEDKKESVI